MEVAAKYRDNSIFNQKIIEMRGIERPVFELTAANSEVSKTLE